MTINDMNVEVHKTWYNKTRVLEDGVTHGVDPTEYTVYQFGMAKNYFMEDREEMTKLLIKDLRDVANHLEKLLEQEKERD